jgi:hypothetical protein
MGLNIMAYLITGVEEAENWSFGTIKYLKTEKFNDFDDLRYSGDREFASNVKFVRHPEGGVDFEERYYRPENLGDSREWVKANVIECNQPRLLKLLDDMEKYPNLYLYFSY